MDLSFNMLWNSTTGRGKTSLQKDFRRFEILLCILERFSLKHLVVTLET